MVKAGVEQVTVQLYPNARHDIFHEEADGTAADVRRCIADWLTAALDG